MGCYLPDPVVSNREASGACRPTDESILDMAVAAARRATDNAGIESRRLGDMRVGVNT